MKNQQESVDIKHGANFLIRSLARLSFFPSNIPQEQSEFEKVRNIIDRSLT